jgi:hypothetical protein
LVSFCLVINLNNGKRQLAAGLIDARLLREIFASE